MKTKCLIMLIATGFWLPIATHAATDCVELAVAMKNKTAWWRDNDFSSALEEWIKQSAFDQFKKQSQNSLNLGIAIEGIPFQLGGDMSKEDYQRIQRDLNTGRKLKIVSHTREQFVEESLSDDAMNVLLACMGGNSSGFHAMPVRRKDKTTVTLVLVYRPIPGSREQCRIMDIRLKGLSFDDAQAEKDAKNFTLTPGQEFSIDLKRQQGRGDVRYEAGVITVVPSIGNQYRKDIEAILNLAVPPKPPTEKISRFKTLVVELQGHPGKVKSKPIATDAVLLCRDIFDALRTTYRPRLQDNIEIDGELRPISAQMKKVYDKLKERIGHYDVSSEIEATREFTGWANNAEKIMDEIQ